MAFSAFVQKAETPPTRIFLSPLALIVALLSGWQHLLYGIPARKQQEGP